MRPTLFCADRIDILFWTVLQQPLNGGALGERTFQRVKVPNPPGSGKGIAEHQGCPPQDGIWRKVEANLRPDGQKSHQAANEDKASTQAKVQ